MKTNISNIEPYKFEKGKGGRKKGSRNKKTDARESIAKWDADQGDRVALLKQAFRDSVKQGDAVRAIQWDRAIAIGVSRLQEEAQSELLKASLRGLKGKPLTRQTLAAWYGKHVADLAMNGEFLAMYATLHKLVAFEESDASAFRLTPELVDCLLSAAQDQGCDMTRLVEGMNLRLAAQHLPGAIDAFSLASCDAGNPTENHAPPSHHYISPSESAQRDELGSSNGSG